MTCKTAITLFPSKHLDLPPAPLNAIPDVSDVELIPKYQRLVGCLLYLAITTRPDISYYMMWLGQYNAKPNHSYFLLAKHVLRYLAGTKTLALGFGAPSDSLPSSLTGYMQNVGCSDVDWASDSMDRKSISGYSFFFKGSLVSWSAVKQKSIALSSTEAEYYAMTHTFKEALWLHVFFSFMEFPVPCPFSILSDNQAACSLSNSISISALSKHIDIRHHFIHAHIHDGSFGYLQPTCQPISLQNPFLQSFLYVTIQYSDFRFPLPLPSFILLSVLMGVCWTIVWVRMSFMSRGSTRPYILRFASLSFPQLSLSFIPDTEDVSSFVVTFRYNVANFSLARPVMSR